MDFRKLRRFKQQISDEECIKVLLKEKRGILAVNGENGYPYALPLDYIYCLDNGKIYFHCAKEGHKLDAIKSDSRVCFTVCEQGEQREDWSYYARSVIIFGKAKILTEYDETVHRVRMLAQKYYPEDSSAEIEDDIIKNAKRMYIIEITPEHMCGKLVHEK